MPMETAEVAARARTENFPIASVLFPRELRPHLRAIYGFARLVDILGDEVEGDRLAALNELERELDACYGESAPSWPVMRRLEPTIRAFSLPREPFLRLIEANRMDQRVSEYESWDDLKGYCVHSADPVGRLVLGLLRRAGARHRLGRRVHRAPARQLPPGRASRSGARPCLPAGGRPPPFRRRGT